MNHAFAFPDKASPHFADPEGMSRPSWMVTYQDGLPVRRQSPIQLLTGHNVD